MISVLVATVLVILLASPLWLPLAAMAIYAALNPDRRHRFPFGHCRKCGYDLAGIAAGVCPECGARQAA